MSFARIFISLILVVTQFCAFMPKASALSSSGVVIAQMYPGSSSAATQEFIELYNNSSSDVDVSNDCVNYISSSGATTTKLACLTPPDTTTRLWIKAGGYATFASNDYKIAANVTADAYFAGGMSSLAGHVNLVNASGAELDRLGWGTATNPETASTPAPANGKSLQRQIVNSRLLDTDNNVSDFVQATPTFHSSTVYEIVTLIDLCPNIPDAQSVVPVGYGLDPSGNCQPDSCLNIAGLQTSVPDGYDSDNAGNCIQHDECDNLSGIQSAIPDNMIRGDGNDCVWDVRPLLLTEILPNAVGSDTGNEFVEVYNPTNQTVNLSLYSVTAGLNGEKSYAFPIGATIAPGEYRAFSDSEMKFTLVNTSSRVQLQAIDGSTLSDTGEYDSPNEGESWAMINDTWQYTNQSTPGAENKASVDDETPVDATDSRLSACAAGKYRSPLTNRCRTIALDAEVLTSCDADQYRNPETGRCKKIDASSLTSCKDGQYRSEETNRCRNIVTASIQKPCKDNQYRNEETNRCRNLPAASVPAAAFAVQPVKQTGLAFAGWWAVGGVGLAGLGYGVWEWHREIGAAFAKLFLRK